MDFDWITGNLYAATGDGNIFVCDTNTVPTSVCSEVISDQEDVEGIALSPQQGWGFSSRKNSANDISVTKLLFNTLGRQYQVCLTNWVMFWTNYENGSIWRSWMDGTNRTPIVKGLNEPSGITIDFRHSRLYWVSRDDRRVQSSDFQGQHVQTVVQLPRRWYSRGIGLLGDRINWITTDTKELQSSTKAGQDIELLHTDTISLRHVAIIPRPDLPKNRTNHHHLLQMLVLIECI